MKAVIQYQEEGTKEVKTQWREVIFCCPNYIAVADKKFTDGEKYISFKRDKLKLLKWTEDEQEAQEVMGNPELSMIN